MSCDYNHMPFHHQKKRNIKSRKINKRKRKILVSKHTITVKIEDHECYELRSLGLDNRTTLILNNTRELNKELFYKLVYLI